MTKKPTKKVTAAEFRRLSTAWENTMIANVDIALMNGELQIKLATTQGELEQARAALAFVVKVTPLDILRNEARYGLVNMQLVDAAFEAAAAVLAAQPQPARADDTRTAGE
jgi:hypothetical protein